MQHILRPSQMNVMPTLFASPFLELRKCRREGNGIKDDAVFVDWKTLNLKHDNTEKDISDSSISASSQNEDLFPSILTILVHPGVKK